MPIVRERERTKKESPQCFTEDDVLEILSMFSNAPELVSAIERAIQMAVYVARSDLIEQDVSGQAKPILQRHIELGQKMLGLLLRAKNEIIALNEQMT